MVGKRSDRQQAITDQLYQDVFDYSPLGLYTLDKDGVITSFNPKMEELSGTPKAKAIGLNALELESYRSIGLDKQLRKGLAGRPFDTEVDYVSLSHKKSIRHYRGVPLKSSGKSGEAHLLLIVEDITLRKQYEQKLVATQKVNEYERLQLLSLINNMADAVIAVDDDLRIMLSNGAAQDILDVNKTLDGQKLPELWQPCDGNNQVIDLTRLIRDCESPFTTRDWKLNYADNDYINLYVSIAPVQAGFGEEANRGWVLLLRDITREKSLEEERDEFISVVSHELRTPIAITEGNIGNAEFVFERSGAPDPGIRDALKQAHDQVNFLSSMINDLATLSRAERGKLEVEIESINTHELCESLVSDYAKQAEEKGLTLHGDLDPSLEMLQSSRLYVREILQNFITNAIKYTHKGHVTIHAKPVKNGVEFAVSDTGIGISKADQERVFDKFFRSEDFHTRAESGTGLGLYVTMKLARLIHAEIELESTPGKGSTFHIFIPNLR